MNWFKWGHFISISSLRSDYIFLFHPNPFHVLVDNHTRLSLLWNAKSSLGSRWSAQAKWLHLVKPAKLQPILSPSHAELCFLTHEVITKLSLWENGCQVSLHSAAKSSWKLCVLMLIPACNHTSDMTARVFVCMHVCKMLHASVSVQCRDPTQWQALGHPPTTWYVCGTLRDCVCNLSPSTWQL